MSAAYERNGQSVSSEDFYAIACDPRRSVAVEACAGAGKTWMLVSRMVRALLDTESPCQAHEILAITFTRRAAGEMRERLYDWLAEFARAKPEDLLAQLHMRGVPGLQDAAHAQRLCGQLAGLYAQVLASGRSVQIRTFHSWFAALLRNAPVAVLQGMGLPVHYELLEDDAPARALLWRRFYALLLQDADLKADFEAVVRQYGRFQADKALQAALDKRVEFVLADAAGVLPASVLPLAEQFPLFAGLAEPDDLLTQAAARQLLMQAAGVLGRASAPTFAACGSDLERALTEKRPDGVFKALLTLDGKPRAFGKKITDIETVRQAQDLLLTVQAGRQQHEAWLYQQRMTRLTRALLEEFNGLKRERGWVDMNDVERAALTMLGDPVLSGWVQEKLDARVKHLLIDEFQDTNPLQWQALRAWLDSYAGAGRAPSVFIVGDPKQSIYRFRRAEPQVFKAAQAFVREGLRGDLLSCDHTRRNARGVIDAVNAAMAQASQNDGYPGFRPHSTSSELPGRLLRLPAIERGSVAAPEPGTAEWRDSLSTPREVPEDTLRTLEARQAAAWLQGQLASQGLKPSELMVLSRKRAGLLPLQDELRALGIAAQVGEKTALIDCCEVQDIVALLDVLVSPQHDLSLARVLRSPLFGVDNAALVQLALARQRLKLSWYELLQLDKASAPELYGGPAQGLTAIAPRLARWQGWVHSLPPHDALQAIYGDGDVLARFAAAAPATQRQAVLANLNALLAVALEHDGGRYVTPYALVRALKAGGVQAPATVDAAAVRLLTIHGAKGLEAPLVLLLDTDSAARSADSMGVLVDWPGEAAHPDRFVFLLTEARPPACCVPTLTAEQEARQREELNALYVALTRAQHTLALSSITPHREAAGSWWQRLQPLVEEDTVPSAAASQPSRADEPFDLPCLPTLPAEHRLPLPEPDATATDSSLARIGLAMHRLLEWGALSALHVQAVTREFHLSPQQAQQALQAAERILSGQGAWAWDPAVLAWQGNEVELAHAGQVLRLDRLVQRQDAGHAGHWWVLDYKSRGDPQTQPELRAQMQGYRDAVQAIHPGQTVKAAFLTAGGALIEL